MTLRLGILASHPIQYHAPLYRELARQVDLKVYFAHRQSAAGQAAAGFNVAFEWDVDLLGGYEHRFLDNQARRPGVSDFFGCDTPAIADEIQRGRFDAFLVSGWYLKSYWQAIRACRRLGVPVMVRGDSQLGTPRSWVKAWVKSIAYPLALRQFDACLYVGQKNRAYLEHYGVPVDRLFSSPHCVDNDAFAAGAQRADRAGVRSRLGIPVAANVVLFVGKLIDVKRPLDMVKALRILRERGIDVRGLVVGDGPLHASLQVQAQEWGVPMVFTGFRNQGELPEVYAMADVLCLPSESETWGLVVNEALACGTPVVVSDAVGCAPDLALDGHTGAVFAMGNALAAADAIHRVLGHPPPPRRLAEAIERHSIAAAAQGVEVAARWVQDRIGAREQKP